MSTVHKKIKAAGNNIIKNTNNIPKSNKSKSISLSNNNNTNPKNNNNNTNIKQKKKSPLTPSINQRERNILLMQGPSGIPGNGLWCQIPKKVEDKPYESIIPKIKAENPLLLDPEKEADKKLIHYNMGIGDWGLGIGDWGLGPIPNPQSPIPKSPIPNHLNFIFSNLNK
jgi:hypothetical protein